MVVKAKDQRTQGPKGGKPAGSDEDQLDDDLDEDNDPDDQDLDDDDDLDDDGDDDEQDEDDDEDEDEGFDEAAFMEKVESRIDRRITSAMNKVMRRLDNLDGGRKNGRSGGERQQQRGSGSGTRNDDPPTADAREARLVYREAIGDLLKFSSPEERKAAANLANGIIASKIGAGGDDEEEIGAEAARDVAKTILDLRKQAEVRVKATLRRQGVLADTKGGQGGTEGRRGKPGTKSELAKGADVAARRHGKAAG